MSGLEVEQTGTVVVWFVLVVECLDVGIRLPLVVEMDATSLLIIRAEEGVLGMVLLAVGRSSQPGVEHQNARSAVTTEVERWRRKRGATVGSAVVINTALFSGVMIVVGDDAAPTIRWRPPRTRGTGEWAPKTTWLRSARTPLSLKRATAPLSASSRQRGSPLTSVTSAATFTVSTPGRLGVISLDDVGVVSIDLLDEIEHGLAAFRVTVELDLNGVGTSEDELASDVDADADPSAAEDLGASSSELRRELPNYASCFDALSIGSHDEPHALKTTPRSPRADAGGT